MERKEDKNNENRWEGKGKIKKKKNIKRQK
jgi:hypothetical protein